MPEKKTHTEQDFEAAFGGQWRRHGFSRFTRENGDDSTPWDTTPPRPDGLEIDLSELGLDDLESAKLVVRDGHDLDEEDETIIRRELRRSDAQVEALDRANLLKEHEDLFAGFFKDKRQQEQIWLLEQERAREVAEQARLQAVAAAERARLQAMEAVERAQERTKKRLEELVNKVTPR